MSGDVIINMCGPGQNPSVAAKYLYLPPGQGFGLDGPLVAVDDKKIELVSIGNDSFISADFSGCSALKYLAISENTALTSLGLAGCSALISLQCSGDDLTALDVTDCAELQSIACFGNGLTSLDLSACPDLLVVYCHENALTSLDFSAALGINDISCYYNALTTINVTGCSALTNLDTSNNSLAALDVSDSPLLLSLYASENALDETNVDGILVALDGFGLSNGGVDLSGGTNAPPSVTGLAAKASLELRGWSVTVN